MKEILYILTAKRIEENLLLLGQYRNKYKIIIMNIFFQGVSLYILSVDVNNPAISIWALGFGTEIKFNGSHPK